MNPQSSRTRAASLRLHEIASVKTMHSKGPIGIIRRIVHDRHIDVHLITDATYKTKAFLVIKHLKKRAAQETLCGLASVEYQRTKPVKGS